MMRAAVFLIWVLSMMFWWCVSTVRLLAKSLRAISALVRPSATKPSTSSSRLLRPKAVRPSAARLPVLGRPNSASPIAEQKNGRPAATVTRL